MKRGLCVSYFPPVYVSNLYWGQCFIQIDFFKLNAHVAVQGYVCLSVCG